MYKYTITLAKKVYVIDIYKSDEKIATYKGKGNYTKATKTANIIVAIKKRRNLIKQKNMENKPEVILVGKEPEPITLLITNPYPLESLVEPYIVTKNNGKANNFIVKQKPSWVQK